jgi:hypothetical protein
LKILAINSWSNPDLSKHSPIDFWRIHSPLEELKKHVDWQIDYLPTFLPGADEFTSPDDFDEAALEKAAKQLGEYDIIISSYQPSPFVFSLLQVVKKHYGTKYILDEDDDVYNIPSDDISRRNLKEQDIQYMQRMVELSDFVCVTTDRLRKSYEDRGGKARLFVIPNYFPDDYHNDKPKDGNRINIGYFGGAGHYQDLHETQILPALEKLMHAYRDVHFTTVGIPLDDYLPKSRIHHIDSGNIHVWLDNIYPSLNFDIVIAPLRSNLFNEAKSNIKWQEATGMGAAFVASDIGPYRDLDPATALLTRNTSEDWYDHLERLVTPEKRHALAALAEAELDTKWLLADHLQAYQDMFEIVYATEQH